MEFKDRLKQYRQDNNLTQDELAEKLFISRQAVSKYETGRGYPAIDVMTELSKLMGISIDELISKEELAKQTIYTGQEVRKNKRNIIIAISMIVVVIIISVVAIVLSSKSMQQSGQPTPAAPKYDYDLVGMVGTTDDQAPDVTQLTAGKLFGYCYLFSAADNKMIGSSYNVYDAHLQMTEYSSYYDMSLLISERQKTVNLYEVYYNPADNDYKFSLSYVMDLTVANKFETELSRDDYSWKFSFNFTSVDKLSGMTIYEYGLNNAHLKTTEYNNEYEYTISPDCLYVVIEEKFEDAAGYEYYNRTAIYNSEIDKHYYYPLKILNDNGFGHKILTINKY